jgi:hypothetical protein
VLGCSVENLRLGANCGNIGHLILRTGVLHFGWWCCCAFFQIITITKPFITFGIIDAVITYCTPPR